ncbi:MAG TPA: hypothetical protein VFV41_01025 [Streptosporangiaceae bacterium]|nr:hypothetical protein [Streptosporangiaceae bacterium]
MTAYHADIDITTTPAPGPDTCIRAGDAYAMSFCLAVDGADAASAEHAAVQSALAVLRAVRVTAD